MDRRLFLKHIAAQTSGQTLPSLAVEFHAQPDFSSPKYFSHLDTREQTKQPELTESCTKIKVIGVGGAGCNFIEHMTRNGVHGVDLIAANTDTHALACSSAAVRLPLGLSGLGTGAQPEIGKAAAEESKDAIRAHLQGTHMLVIVAGMGGGTGSGAASVIARIAKEMGIFTVSVVSKPFSFEGSARMQLAEACINELIQQVESLIVIPNETFLIGLNENTGVDECFFAVDECFRNTVGSITDIITNPSPVAVDFKDVRTVMGGMGLSATVSGVGNGIDRARIAVEQAIASPLLGSVKLSNVEGILVNVTAGHGLEIKELNVVMNAIRSLSSKDTNIIFGAVYDDRLGDTLRATIVATGIGEERFSRTQAVLGSDRIQSVHQDLVDKGTDPDDIPAFLRPTVK